MKSFVCKILLAGVSLFAVVFYLSSCSEDPAPEPAEEEKPAPVIDAIFPTTGIAGITVTITGKNFSTKTVENIVTFNGVRAHVTSATGNQLVVEAPATGSSGDVAVKLGSHQNVGPAFKYYEVFVVGNDFPGDGNCIIKMWRNTIPEPITNGTSNILSTSIGISGDDIYISGYNTAGTGAFVWKNKVPSTLQAGVAFTEKIAIDGNDVYVMGADNGGTKYWKNGSGVILPTPEPYLYNLVLGGFKVLNGDVYIAGTVTSDDDKQSPLYWKNGVDNFLTHNEDDPITVTDITIDGPDIYVLGSSSGGSSKKLRYWKNNVVNYITDGTAPAYASRLIVYNGDVYIAGGETINGLALPRIWKNGVPLSFTWMDKIKDAGGINLSIVDMSIIDGNIIYTGNQTTIATFRTISYVAINDHEVFLPSLGFTTNARGLVAR